MDELFNNLLDISKLDALVLTPAITDFPIAHLLKRTESTFAATARKKGLSFRIVSNSAWVRSDPILLERILLNLVSNAVGNTASGGIVIGCRRRGAQLRIEVWDSGHGIPEDQHQNIFAEFHQLAGPQHATTGMRLFSAPAYHIAQRVSTVAMMAGSVTAGKSRTRSEGEQMPTATSQK